MKGGKSRKEQDLHVSVCSRCGADDRKGRRDEEHDEKIEDVLGEKESETKHGKN